MKKNLLDMIGEELEGTHADINLFTVAKRFASHALKASSY
jgi:hypothetical protein